MNHLELREKTVNWPNMIHKAITRANKGFCQSCKQRLDFNVVNRDCYFRFCDRCKASDYLKKEHFTKEGELILIGKKWKLRSTETWSIATNDTETIELGFGFDHVEFLKK